MSDAERRVAVVLEHVRLENVHDFPACIAMFGRPRYEVISDEAVFDGTEAVEGFLKENRRAFPDFHFEAKRVVAAGDAVLAEGIFTGTQDGVWRGLPATGRPVEFPMCVVFDFEGDEMVSERLYFDLGIPLCQLGVAYDPDSAKGKLFTVLNHPITIIRALLRTARLRVTRRKR